ncbi:hypothetical protein TRIUR3_13758 [Triticum urartu]|uniref:Uncharacterized protein n=1 Tax=Triticum urartu TaxID=4572 RepID=M7ZEF5_TRIUA|nr:hypothetical protein TRIUR3_13758 [Triticum urartu]
MGRRLPGSSRTRAGRFGTAAGPPPPAPAGGAATEASGVLPSCSPLWPLRSASVAVPKAAAGERRRLPPLLRRFCSN